MQNNKQWNKAYAIYKTGDEDRAIALFTELADRNDWTGSYMLGCIFQERGRQNQRRGEPYRPSYLLAARWYRQALSQEEQCSPHYGLARHYYYGLGGIFDYKQAFEHLQKSCLEDSPLAQVMMAELLWCGLGAPKDINAARVLFTSAVNAGYPAGLVGLRRMAILERKFIQATVYYFRSLFMAIKLVIKNKNHPQLVGIGGKWGDFRLKKMASTKQGKEKVTELYPPSTL